MEDGTDNPEPSWPLSAHTRACAAAEPGIVQVRSLGNAFPDSCSDNLSTAAIGGNGHNAVQAILPDYTLGQSVSTSFVDEQLGDLTNLNRSPFAENNRVSIVDYGHSNAYDSVATPGNYTHADPWATAHPSNHALAPFTNLSPSHLTGSTFAPGFAGDAADKDGTALPTAPFPYAWGVAAPAIHSNNNTFAPFVNSDLSPLTENNFAGNAAYNEGTTLPTGLDPYTWGAAVPTAHSNKNTFTPFVNSSHLQSTKNNFAANAAYNGCITYPTAPSPYTLGAAASAELMNHYMGPGLQYPHPALAMMDPFAADTNGNCYHGHFPATSLNTQWGAAIEPPTASHATHDSDAVPLDLAHLTPSPRPTCPTCNRSFGRQADLDRHAKSHRADAKVYRCGCGYSSYRKDKLDEHVRRSGHRAVVVSLNGV